QPTGRRPRGALQSRGSRWLRRRSTASRSRTGAGKRPDAAATGIDIESGSSGPPRLRQPQPDLGFVHYLFQTRDLAREHTSPERRQPVIAPPRILPRWTPLCIFHQTLIHQPLQIVVKCSRPELVLAIRLLRYLLHDPVAVAVFTGERKQDVQRG